MDSGDLVRSCIIVYEHLRNRFQQFCDILGISSFSRRQMMAVPLTKETMIPGNDDYDPYFDEGKGEPSSKTEMIEQIEKVAGASSSVFRCVH